MMKNPFRSSRKLLVTLGIVVAGCMPNPPTEKQTVSPVTIRSNVKVNKIKVTLPPSNTFAFNDTVATGIDSLNAGAEIVLTEADFIEEALTKEGIRHLRACTLVLLKTNQF